MLVYCEGEYLQILGKSKNFTKSPLNSNPLKLKYTFDKHGGIVCVEYLTKDKIRIGVSVICWSIWHCRNTLVFNRKDTFNVLQVIYMAVHWIQFWAFLLHSNQRELMEAGCMRLLRVS